MTKPTPTMPTCVSRCRASDPALVKAGETPREIYYAVAQISSVIVHRRIAHAEQSAASRRLLAATARRADEIDALAVRHSSLAHSRAVSAAAIGIGVRVGIDVEWMAPNRDGQTILELVCGLRLPSLPADDFYRAWTFHEAYFKATGTVADKDTIRHVILSRPGDALRFPPDGDGPAIGAVQMRWSRDFMLSIVWTVRDVASVVDLVRVFDPIHGRTLIEVPPQQPVIRR